MTYEKYAQSVLQDQERYDRQQRLSETGFCIPPITIRPVLISEQEYRALCGEVKP